MTLSAAASLVALFRGPASMRLTRGFCDGFDCFVVCDALSRILYCVIGRPIVVTLATATSASTSRALGLLSVLLATGVICVDLSGLLLCVRRLVTLRLAVSTVAAIVTVVSAAAVALTVVVAVLAIVALTVTRSIARSSAVLFALTAAIVLALF